MKIDSHVLHPSLIPTKAGLLLLNSVSKKERYVREGRQQACLPMVKPVLRPGMVRTKVEHFCQLRSGTKHVLQWHAYLAGSLLLLAGRAGGAAASAT